MANPNTVFIVGAGASREANLPDGSELTERISILLNFSFDAFTLKTGDSLIFEALRESGQSSKAINDVGAHVDAGRIICDAMPLAKSIDNFIDHHKGNKYVAVVGKLAITRSILDAEFNSLLYRSPMDLNSQPKFGELSKTWFKGFFEIVTGNCQFKDIGERARSISLIVFNYDRCIEQFLYYAFQTYYSVTKDQAADLVNSMAIYHPYGTVGNLQWQKRGPAIEYGDIPSALKLSELSRQIKTFTEGTDTTSSEILEIRKRVKEAKKLVFLGFAFHPLNLNLLFESAHAETNTPGSCYATAFGISDSNCMVIRDRLRSSTGWKDERIVIRNHLRCSELLREYERSLS